jgi:hypothetical protein
MNDAIIAQLDKEIAAIKGRLHALEAMRKARTLFLNGDANTKVGALVAAVTGLPPPTGVYDALMKRQAAEAKERAPKGALEEAMLKAIAAKPGLTNGEVRAALKKSGYKYALGSLYVGKRLVRLVEAKRLTVKLDGSERRYYPVK